MSTENITIHILVIFLLVTRTIYWRISKIKADSEKPNTKKRTSFIKFQIIIRDLLNFFILIQLLGLNILPLRKNLLIEILGFCLCVLAVSFSYFGRNELGTNWADAPEYQIKQKHTLITSGIYHYVRHPIYVGVSLFIIGSELVVGSWLVIPFGLFLIVVSYIRSKKEEVLLTEHFGQEYISYMKKTTMFIPRIF